MLLSMKSLSRALALVVSFTLGEIIAVGPSTVPSPLDRKVGTLTLQHETLFDGLAKLNSMDDSAFSVEMILKPALSSPSPENPRFSASIENATLRQELDWLVQLDPRYVWVEDHGMINVFPRDKLKAGEAYFLNRRVLSIEYVNIKSWVDAVFFTVGQLPGKKEQIAIMQAGGSATFTEPWTAEFTDITVRQAFNRIAKHYGKGCGWVLRGTTLDFRVIMFHQRL